MKNMSTENKETLGNCETKKNTFDEYQTARVNSLPFALVGENKIRSIRDLRSKIPDSRSLIRELEDSAAPSGSAQNSPPVVARRMILMTIGERTIANVYLPPTLRSGTYLVMKKLDPAVCKTGRTTNQFFVGLGLDVAMRVFRRACPVWFDLEMTSKGIKANYHDHLNPNIPILWAKTILSIDDFPNAAAWNITDIDLFTRSISTHDDCLASIYASLARSILRNGCFNRDDSMIIMSNGKVYCTKPNYEPYLTSCLGQIVRIYAGFSTVNEVFLLDPRRTRHNTFDSDIICPFYEFIRETFARWKVRTDHPITYDNNGGRWFITGTNADFQAQLLLRCGDVETNPGPTKTVVILCAVAVVFYYQNNPSVSSIVDDFFKYSRRTIEPVLVKVSGFNPITTFRRLIPTIPSLPQHLFDAYVTLPLKNIAYDCAYDDRVNEFWRNEYDNNPTFTQLAHKFWPKFMDIPTRPSRDFVTYKCKLAYHFVGKPFIPDFRPPSGYLIIKDVLVYAAVTLSILSTAIVVVTCVLVARRRRIYIVNPNRCVNFDTDMAPLRLLLSKHDKSVQSLFAACVAHVSSSVSKVRVVDFARCCPTAYINDIHVCSTKSSRPTNDYDVDHCDVAAYDCPQKSALPFTIINCSDHAFTQTELCDIVTGPTLIISPHANGGGCVVRRVNDRISLLVGNGHSVDGHLHPWSKAGVVMGLRMAFEYRTIFTNEFVHVVFCVPAHGVYSRDSAEVMPQPKPTQLPVIDGYSITQSATDYVLSDGLDEFKIAIGFIEQVSMSLSPITRDEKYAQTAVSYVTAQAKAYDLSMQKLSVMTRLVCYFADLHALNCVSNNTVLLGRPGDFDLKTRIIGRIRLWANRIAPSCVKHHLIQLFGHRWVEPAVRWTFPVVYVPTYEIHTRMNKCLRLFGMATRHVIDRFPSSPSNADARPDDEDHSSAGEDTVEHDNVTGNAGTQSGSTAPSFSDQQPRKTSCSSSNEGFSTTPPIGPTDCEQMPQASGHTNAESSKAPSSCQSGTPNGRPDVVPPVGRPRARADPVTEPDPPCRLRPDQGRPVDGPIPPNFGTSSWEDLNGKQSFLHTHFVGKTDSKVILDEDLSNLLYDTTKTEAEAAAEWIDEVRNDIRKVDPRFGTKAQIMLLCRFALDPQTFKAGRVLEFNGGDLLLGGDDASHRDRCSTIGFRGLGSSISFNTTEPVAGGAQPNKQPRVEFQRSANKEFPKDRNERQRHRPKKHKPSL
nr:MAG: methyltransferase [Crogonang virus 34]